MRGLIFVSIVAIVAFFFINSQSPETFSCIRPIHYSLGEFDGGFDISREDFLKSISKAEDVWEKESGKELFVYDEKGNFKINLIFDERQERTNLVEVTEEELNREQAGYTKADEVYKNLVTRYEKEGNELQVSVAEYETMSNNYSKNVEEWNNSSRQDKDELARLKQEGKEVDAAFKALKADEAALKELYAELQTAREKRNALVSHYNESVSDFNQKFAGEESFDQGDYMRGKINIYQFEDKTDLELVLAHELGHALGIKHVDDPGAIMYYLLSEQPRDPITLDKTDKDAFDKRCSLF